jgi:hypothetical protein
MMKTFLAGLMSVLAMVAASDRALACGGCFAPPADTSVVTGHRMAFAVSAERTVLWDQFEYEGSPEDFSWVLPVAPGAVLEASTDAWFESLEALTQTQVTAPTLLCATRGGGGCALGGAESGLSASSGFIDEGGVRVLHRGTVGPYDTVTLRSTGGDALTTWLRDNGYLIPTDIEPIIAAYVTEGADFIALKLSPGQGIQQMTPVRVVTPGGDPILPLRMVAAGTGAFVDIVLYILGEGRFVMPDLHGMLIDERTLTWDFATNRSDYLERRAAALEQHEGRSYLTTFSEPRAFNRTFESPNGLPVLYAISEDFSRSPAADFVGVYFSRAALQQDENASLPPCDGVRTALDGQTVVTESASPSFTCSGATDLAAAMIGMRPAEAWLTRLEMRLPREALDMDCAVERARDPDPVSNQLLARRSENRTCPAPIFTSRLAPATAPLEGWTLAVALGALLGRARRRRERLTR